MKTLRYLPLLLLLSGCATHYYQLQPVSGAVANIEGRNVTKASADSVEVVASFEREDMDYLAMDVEVKNQTDRPLTVDPATFRVVALDVNQQPVQASANVMPFRQAADPAYETERTKQNVVREERRIKTAKVVNTLLLVAVVASDIASSSNSRNRRDFGSWASNRVAHNNAYNLIQAKRVIDHGLFANRMQRYDFDAYRWRELAMKRSVLQPGESARGFVYLPKARPAQYLRLDYPTTDSTAASITFRQELTKRRPR